MSENNFIDDMFEGIQESPEGRIIKNNFFPWHNPRKHLVRIEQWIHYISHYLKKPLKGATQLKYFSLPGDDLLDIRTIHDEICLKNKITLRFLGFNDHTSEISREQNANLSLAEVRSLPYIDKSSQYHDNDILNITSKESLVYQRFKEFGDFDIVNLDFCGSITRHKPANKEANHYNFLSKIIQLQNHRDRPWIMFLTTRVGNDHIHKDTLEILKRCFLQNLNDDEFKRSSEEHFRVSDSDSLQDKLNTDEFFRKIISTSFCKWLLTYSLNLTPKTTMKVLDVMEYKVSPESNTPDMLSFALMFTPHHDQITDPNGLAVSVAKVEKFREPTIASYYINKMIKATDCDKYMEEDQDKKEKMIQLSMALLKTARYDVSTYRDFFQ